MAAGEERFQPCDAGKCTTLLRPKHIRMHLDHGLVFRETPFRPASSQEQPELSKR